jgi:hypothetical protein
MAQTRLQPVEIENTPDVSRETPRSEATFANLLAVSLRALSQRAVIALASLVDLALIASAFVLWLKVIREPTVLQLGGIGMYAAFILIAIYARKR